PALAHAREVLVTLLVSLLEAPLRVLEPGRRVGVGVDHDRVAVQRLRLVADVRRARDEQPGQQRGEATCASHPHSFVAGRARSYENPPVARRRIRGARQLARAGGIMKLDPRKTWRLVEERLARERDPGRRRNLETLLAHMKAEMSGDLDGLMATVAE